MPHPKRRTSKSKRDKRRTHKAICPKLSICSLTKQIHLSHRAYWCDGILYYRGQVILQKADSR